MSSRARLINREIRVERFDWGSDHDPAGVTEAPAPLTPLRVTTAIAPPDAPPEFSPAEHQSHLASLERDAFAKGYAQGERAGVEAGAKRADAMLRRVAQTLEDLAQLRKTIVRETEREMVQLSLALARRIVLREISLDTTLIAAMAHVALERLGESVPATIRLHPEEYATLCALRGDRWEGAQVTIVPDPTVARGGCLVESAFGTIDGNVDAQLDEMSRALLGDSTAPAAPALNVE